MSRVIITGALGAGKTTLLADLAARGYRTVSESARAIIAERRAAGLSPRPAPEDFAREILRRDVEKYKTVASSEGWVFFDRAAIEALGMVHEATPLPHDTLESTLAQLSFHRTVFLLPPWKGIYANDAERDHPFEHANRVHESLLAWYARCGYTIQVVPCLPVKERGSFVLKALECSAA